MRYLSVCILLCLCIVSCKEEDIIVEPKPIVVDPYSFVQPSNFPASTYTFDNNPVTEAGFKLGKKLFFDPILSRDNSISCGSCHKQQTAFADGIQHSVSVGVDDRLGTRNAPPLTNLAFMKEFFWDGGVTHLDFVPVNAITASFEMDETLLNVVSKLNAKNEYRVLFKEAFKTDSINSAYMLHALSQFMVMMVSSNSKYDKAMRGEGEILTSDELQGMQLFKEKCSSCHSGVLFSDFSYRNNGLTTQFADSGRARITELTSEIGKFRVPSLRNVERTAPYMHDASFLSLTEVLDHYSSGIHDSKTLDPSLKQGVSMNEDQKKKIITFLKTLTDYDFVNDARFFESSN